MESNNEIRIDKIHFENKSYDNIWIYDDNKEESLEAVEKQKIKFIRLYTSDLDILSDKRIKGLVGITVVDKVKDIESLYNFPDLKYLSIYFDLTKGTFDFGQFKKLVSLGGTLPKKYINLDKLVHLKKTHLFKYRKADFTEFSMMKDLEVLNIYSSNCENFVGLSGLVNLKKIELERCPKLASLQGIGEQNISLEYIRLMSCKNLKDVSVVSEIQNLKYFQLYKVAEIDSLECLYDLKNLEKLYIYPSNVGVKNEDFYPLVRKLKELDALSQLGWWKILDKYLNNEIIISKGDGKEELSVLSKLNNQKPIEGWVDKLEDGLEQYTLENCKRAQLLVTNLIQNLEKNEDVEVGKKVALIKECVVAFNKLNDELGGDFIETGEREELCDIFDDIADAVGIDVQEYEDGIASEWREW